MTENDSPILQCTKYTADTLKHFWKILGDPVRLTNPDIQMLSDSIARQNERQTVKQTSAATSTQLGRLSKLDVSLQTFIIEALQKPTKLLDNQWIGAFTECIGIHEANLVGKVRTPSSGDGVVKTPKKPNDSSTYVRKKLTPLEQLATPVPEIDFGVKIPGLGFHLPSYMKGSTIHLVEEFFNTGDAVNVKNENENSAKVFGHKDNDDDGAMHLPDDGSVDVHAVLLDSNSSSPRCTSSSSSSSSSCSNSMYSNTHVTNNENSTCGGNKQEEYDNSSNTKKRKRNGARQQKQVEKELLQLAKKKEMDCKYWTRNGSCQLGDECMYSHDLEFVKRKELCKYVARGKTAAACTRGEACSYSHDFKQFPCRFHFQNDVSTCTSRDQCLYSHDIVNDKELAYWRSEWRAMDMLKSPAGNHAAIGEYGINILSSSSAASYKPKTNKSAPNTVTIQKSHEDNIDAVKPVANPFATTASF